jgi:hypothetical protein
VYGDKGDQSDRDGMFGCILSKEERGVYLSLMDPYYLRCDVDRVVFVLYFEVGKVSLFHGVK